VLLHCLEQRRLRLRRRAVDFVRRGRCWRRSAPARTSSGGARSSGLR
jgi:hypothetical protein